MSRLTPPLLAAGLLLLSTARAAEPDAPTLRITRAAFCCDRVDADHRRLGCAVYTDFELRNPGPATLQLRSYEPDFGPHSALPEWPGPYEANGFTISGGVELNCSGLASPTRARQTVVLEPGDTRGWTVQGLNPWRTEPVTVAIDLVWALSPDDPDAVTSLRAEVPWSLPVARGPFHAGECRDYRLWPEGAPAEVPRRGRDRVYPTSRRI